MKSEWRREEWSRAAANGKCAEAAPRSLGHSVRPSAVCEKSTKQNDKRRAAGRDDSAKRPLLPYNSTPIPLDNRLPFEVSTCRDSAHLATRNGPNEVGPRGDLTLAARPRVELAHERASACLQVLSSLPFGLVCERTRSIERAFADNPNCRKSSPRLGLAIPIGQSRLFVTPPFSLSSSPPMGSRRLPFRLISARAHPTGGNSSPNERANSLSSISCIECEPIRVARVDDRQTRGMRSRCAIFIPTTLFSAANRLENIKPVFR